MLREATLLLTLPTRDGRVFLHKFQEAVVLNSWGFLLLGSPLLLAFGIVAKAPWYYYAVLLPFMLAFTYVPMAMGAIFCLALVRCVPRAGNLLWILGGAVLLSIATAAGWWLLTSRESNLLTPAWFQEMTGRLQFTQSRLLPSWWLSAGLLEAAHDNGAECLKFLALMIANALFWREVAIHVAVRVYRAAYEGVRPGVRTAAGRRGARRRHPPALAPLPLGVRLMMLKDLRLFRRDPVQWSQFLIFFGLMVLYFVNIHPFSYDINYAGWLNMISFLNLAVVGLLMSTFTTRFIFPMVSLEGRRFWFLAMLPLRRETILWSKFVFALAGSALPCSALILLSDLILGVRLLIGGIHQLTCLLLCLGLSGIAVGLGARCPIPRRVALADRRGIRRHAQSRRQHPVRSGHRRADGDAAPFLSCRRRQPRRLVPHVTRTFLWWLRVWMIGGMGRALPSVWRRRFCLCGSAFAHFADWSFERTGPARSRSAHPLRRWMY